MKDCDCVERHLDGVGPVLCPGSDGCLLDSVLPKRLCANLDVPLPDAMRTRRVYLRCLPGRDDVVLVGRPAPGASLPTAAERARPVIDLALGFPFPIVHRAQPCRIPPDSKYAFTIAARGAGVSARLRRTMLKRLQMTLPLKVLRCDARTIRAGLSNALAVRATALLYVDPFRFVGDSVSHLVHRDAALRMRRWAATASITANANVATLDEFTHGSLDSAVVDLREKAQHIVVIAPNYLDDQWASTLATIRTVLNGFATGCVVVPGRGLLVTREEGSPTVSVLTVKREPRLLSDAPVEWTQDVGLRTFGLPRLTRRQPILTTRAASVRVLIAPLASSQERSLSVSMVNGLVRGLLEGTTTKATVLLGPPGDPRSQEMIEGIDHGVASALPDLTLREAVERIACASLCVVADSFAAHLAVRAGVPSVVLYSADCADETEPESLLHHSALGFCSRSPFQLPCLLSSFSSPAPRDWHALAHCRELLAFLTGRSAPTQETVAIARDFVRQSQIAIRRPAVNLDRIVGLWQEAVSAWTSQKNETHRWVWSWYDPSLVLSALSTSSRKRSPATRARLVQQAIQVSPTAKLLRLLEERR